MAMFTVFLQLISALARFYNASQLIQIENAERMLWVTLLFTFSYMTLSITIFF
jgi:hypothetical protein